jgi:uncharacterized membrane protein
VLSKYKIWRVASKSIMTSTIMTIEATMANFLLSISGIIDNSLYPLLKRLFMIE